jgi:uncharacterized protein
MSAELTVPVGDLIGSPGKERPFAGTREVSLRLGDSVINDPMTVTGRVLGLIDAVRAELTVAATARLTCTRCLQEWDELISVEAEQYYRKIPDEDGYAIVDNTVDVSSPAQDELALALPLTPLCREDCLGLCPTCGTDLNENPCGGHGDDSDSPFAVLKDLFES